MAETMRVKTMPLAGTQPNAARAAEVKALRAITDLSGPVLRVLGVPFGGPISGHDAMGEAFHPDTDLWLKVGDQRPVTYCHGFGPDDPADVQAAPAVIGAAEYTGADERGHWFAVRLDVSEPLGLRVAEALQAGGAVRASSGALSHLVRDSRGGMLDVWPLGELAVFDVNDWRQPANDFAVVEMVTDDGPQTEVKAAPAARLPVAPDSDDPSEHEPNQPVSSVEDDMTEVTVDLDALKTEITTAAVTAAKAAVAELAAEPPEQRAEITAPAIKRVTDRGFADDAVKTFMHWLKTGDEVAAKAALQGQTDGEGGYLVPDDFYARVVEKRNLSSWVRQAPVTIISTSLDRVLVPVENVAATKFVVTAEEAAYDENEPTFAQVALTVHKVTKLIKVSEELLADNKANLDGYLSAAFGRALALAENYYFTIGGGGAEPQGVLTGATSSAITSAAATAITTTELSQLKYKLGGGYEDNASTGFLMQNATLGYLRGLTGNPFQFVPTPAAGDLFGRPAYVSDSMPALAATNKAALYGNFNYYAVAEREGLVVMRNPYLYQATGQVGLFARARFGGAVLQAEAFYYMTQHA